QLAHTHRRSRKSDLRQPRANPMLPGQKRRPTGRTGLLAVVVQKTQAIFRNSIDVRRVISHQPVAVAAQVGDADVIAEDDENVRLLVLGRGGWNKRKDKARSNREGCSSWAALHVTSPGDWFHLGDVPPPALRPSVRRK